MLSRVSGLANARPSNAQPQTTISASIEGSAGYDQALQQARNAIRPYVEQEDIEEEDNDAAIVREVRERRQQRDEAQQQRNLDANRHSANPFSPDVRRRSIPPPY